MPALLLEDLPTGVDIGVEHRVHVHVHEVEQVLLVGAAHGVHGLVREGQGVQEGLHTGAQQVHEGLLDREFLRAAQHRMLQDVKHAGVVDRRGFEGDGKALVFVLILQEEQSSPTGGMLHDVGKPVNLRQFLRGAHHKSPAGVARREGRLQVLGKHRPRLRPDDRGSDRCSAAQSRRSSPCSASAAPPAGRPPAPQRPP